MEIDEEEAKFQAEQRKKSIEGAKTLLYYETDRVKQLHVSVTHFTINMPSNDHV